MDVMCGVGAAVDPFSQIMNVHLYVTVNFWLQLSVIIHRHTSDLYSCLFLFPHRRLGESHVERAGVVLILCVLNLALRPPTNSFTK